MSICPKHPELSGKRYANGACYKCNADYARGTRKRDREKVFAHYGNTCYRCGFGDHRALTIDHENQMGSEHKSSGGKRLTSYQLYRWLVKNEFPAGFRTLCANCQFIVYYEYTDGNFHKDKI